MNPHLRARLTAAARGPGLVTLDRTEELRPLLGALLAAELALAAARREIVDARRERGVYERILEQALAELPEGRGVVYRRRAQNQLQTEDAR